MEVKICGITNMVDARMAVEMGASALGFNFYPRSPRYINPQRAAAIIKYLPRRVKSVGVFVNADLDSINHIISQTHINIVQLHGGESRSFCQQLSLPVIKAIATEAEAQDVYKELYAILVDARDEQRYGGTGKTSDWQLAQKVARAFPVFLAGGLHAGNIREAVKMVRPMGVDVCSGVEMKPGKKCSTRMQEFFHHLQNVAWTRSLRPGLSCALRRIKLAVREKHNPAKSAG